MGILIYTPFLFHFLAHAVYLGVTLGDHAGRDHDKALFNRLLHHFNTRARVGRDSSRLKNSRGIYLLQYTRPSGRDCNIL